MASEEIDPIGFARGRAGEIQAIEAAIRTSRKKSMLFQRLPFYLRRRTKSHEKRGKRKRCVRKKDRHGLRTHTWYAKRFEMLKVWGTAVPLRRRMKSSKFIYKSQNRGFIFDESYKKVVVYSRPSSQVLGIDLSLVNVVQEVRHGNGILEAVVTNEHLIVISMCSDEVEQELGLTKHGVIECCLSVIKADELFSNEINESSTRFSKFLVSRKNMDTDRVLKEGSDSIIYFRSLSKVESGKVLLKRTKVLDFWQDIVNTGVVPVCVEELQRIALENDYMIYPFDYPGTKAYEDFERAYVEPLVSKYNRTPPSKKMKMDLDSMYIHTEDLVVFGVFEMERGIADRCASVFDGDRVVGRVIRGSFCFTRGLCKGLCYLLQDASEGDEFYTRNAGSTSLNQIKIVKVFRH